VLNGGGSGHERTIASGFNHFSHSKVFYVNVDSSFSHIVDTHKMVFYFAIEIGENACQSTPQRKVYNPHLVFIS
jgi:hypothetical protein